MKTFSLLKAVLSQDMNIFKYTAKRNSSKIKKIMFPLMVLVIIGMNLFSFSQVMTWIAGNITYLFIIPVILWYFYFILNNDKYNKWFVFIFSLINLFGCMFVENMAIVIIVGNILLLIFKFIKNK